jgi:hypothetical protein
MTAAGYSTLQDELSIALRSSIHFIERLQPAEPTMRPRLKLGRSLRRRKRSIARRRTALPNHHSTLAFLFMNLLRRQAFNPSNGSSHDHPTDIDEKIAREVASRTDHRAERIARAVIWGADEQVLLALSSVAWLCTRGLGKYERQLGNHFLACSLASTLLPHILKALMTRSARTV